MKWYLVLSLCSICADAADPSAIERLFVEMPSQAICESAASLNTAASCWHIPPEQVGYRQVKP